MLTILLIDDEELELDGLERMLKSMDLDIEICGKARCAQDGIALAEQLSPNVILSDVKMPGMDGIEMAHHIRSAGIDSSLFFISGYQDFAAAQQAIELGAQAYILKPVNRDNLKNILLTVGNAKQLSIRAQQERQHVGNRLKKLNNIERDAFYKKLLFTHIDNSQIEIIEEAHRLGIALTSGKFAVMSFNFRAQSVLNDDEFFSMLCNLCMAHNALPPVRDRLGQAVVLFNFPDFLSEEQIMEHLETTSDAMLSRFAASGANDVCIGVSETTAKLVEVCSLANQSRRALLQSFFKGMGCVLFYEEANASPNISESRFSHTHAILEAVSNGDSQQVDALIRSLFLNADGSMTREELQGMCIDVLSSTLSMCRDAKINNQLSEDHEASLYASLLGIQTLEKTCDFMREFLNGACDAIIAKRSQQGAQLVLQIEKIVAEQYMKQISIEDIAAQVYLSPSYVRRVFKNRTGVTIADHLQSVRLSKALELLQQPQCKIYEVGALVGYENPSYFTMVFKKVYGTTPGAYREKLSIYERQ